MNPSRVAAVRQKLEARLKELSVTFPANRSSRWEYAKFPDMAVVYRFVAGPSLVPDQMSFAHGVAALLKEQDNPDVIARACRAYPALVRQHHFELLLRERGNFSLVVHSTDLDLEGIDILVVEEGIAAGLRLSVQTPAAAFWKVIKAKRHPIPRGLAVLDLEAKPDGYRIGQFWLHSPDQVDVVRAFVDRLRDHVTIDRSGYD